MAQIFQGAMKDKLATEQRVDTRRWSVRMADAWSNPFDATILAIILSILSTILNIIPLASLLISPLNAFLARRFLYPKKRLHNVPFRIPKHLKMPDGSTDHTAGIFTPANAEKFYGKGECMYGYDRETNLQVWASDDDDRIHTLILGTTGSGKTEAIHALLINTVLNNSGFIACDAKGDIAFQERQTQLLRRLGRHDDLLTITYAAGKRDFSKPQDDKPSNTFNIMADTSAGMLTELIAGMLDGGGGSSDMWLGRCIAFLAALTTVLVFLRDQGEIELSPAVYLSFMELAEIERLANNPVYKEKYPSYERISSGLRDYLITLPGYIAGKTPGSQEGKTNEQFGFITMQLTRVLNDLGYNYGHIFGTEIGDVDISDVVFNRRCLTVLLPSLERSIPTLNMLGKLIIASIKQMMAGSLGATLEGSRRLIVDARPTSADAAFRVVLDEVGYMMSVGMSIIPAQARSINIAMVFAAQSFSDLKNGSPTEAEAIWANCNMKLMGKLSDGVQSETVQKIQGIAGDVEQMYIDGYHSHVNDIGNTIFKSSQSVRRERRSAIDWQDLAAQVKGQFHLITSKTEDAGKTGGMRVIRMLMLYAGVKDKLPDLYINSFIPISKLSDLQGYEINQPDYVFDALMNDRLLPDINSICDSQTENVKDAAQQLIDRYQNCVVSSDSITGLKNRVDSMVAHVMTNLNVMNKPDTEPHNFLSSSIQVMDFDDINTTMLTGGVNDNIVIETQGYGEVAKNAHLTRDVKYDIGDLTKPATPIDLLFAEVNPYDVDEEQANLAANWVEDVIIKTEQKHREHNVANAIKKNKKRPVL